ncbi:MAG: threonine synthase, partial [Deferribacterota bacterium]|nr:threonine synthase [Deferribacterota bacterium]
MKYFSTRNSDIRLTFEESVYMGLAPDGGLLVPEGIPFIDDNALKVLRDYKYVDLAVYIINKFWPEVETSVLTKVLKNSYRNFYNDRIVTIKDL